MTDLKAEIKELIEQKQVFTDELAALKKQFLEESVTDELYAKIKKLEQQLSGIGLVLDEKTTALYQDMQSKISRDYAGLPVLKEQYETLVDQYSMDAGVMIRKAIKTLIATDLLFQTDLACKLEQLSQDVARNHSTASEAFTTGLQTRQDLGLADLEAMNHEIQRIEGLVPGSSEAESFINNELESMEVIENA